MNTNNINRFSSLLKTGLPLAKQYGKMAEFEALSRLLEHGLDKNVVLLICGEFKRGKSSLVNALLDAEICPVADGIATSAVSIITYGKSPKVTRFYSSLSEDCDGKNNMSIKSEPVKIESISTYAKGTALDIDNTLYLEIEIPNKVLLEKGLTLIDTPGIGSLDPRHLFLTQQALPRADALFFVTDTAEPMLITELDFLKDTILPLKKPLDIILSKSDLVGRDELDGFKRDTEEKISQYCGSQVCCIPVSSTEWNEYNHADEGPSKERRKRNSNCEMVFSSIDAFHSRKVRSIEESFRTQYLALLNSVRYEIEKSLSDLSKAEESIDIQAYRTQLEEMKALREMVLNEDSEFRNNINSIIETSQDQIFEDFSKQSVLLSSDKLEEVLKDPRAVEEDGDKFVIAEMNKEIQKIGATIDNRIDTAITDVIQELKEFIDNVELTSKTNDTQVNGTIVPISHSFSENFVNLTRQALPFMGVATIGGGVAGLGLGLGAGILGITSAALPVVAVGIGIAAGLFYVIQSIKGTKKQEALNNIRRQITPRINIALNEMRTYIQKRYTIFNKEVIKALKSIARSMTEQMQEKVKLLQECEKDGQKKAATQKELQNQLNMVDNLITQTSVLNINPFAHS